MNNICQFRTGPDFPNDIPKRRKIVSPSQWMRVSQRIPKRAVTTLESPSNAVPIALLKDKNHVKILRQFHQHVINSASEINPQNTNVFADIQPQNLNVFRSAGATVKKCPSPADKFVAHDGRIVDPNMVPVQKRKELVGNDEPLKDVESIQGALAVDVSVPVTPIPMTQNANWSEQQERSISFSPDFSLELPLASNKEYIKAFLEDIRKESKSNDVIRGSTITGLDSSPVGLAEKDTAERRPSSSLAGPAKLNLMKNGVNVGSSQFQQRLKALKQAGLVDMRARTPPHAMHPTAKSKASEIANNMCKTPMEQMQDRIPGWDPAPHLSTSAKPDDCEQLQHIGVHRSTHEVLQVESVPEMRPRHHILHVHQDAHAHKRLGVKPVEPKEASPFIYPLTFLKHMFSPYSSVGACLDNESLHHPEQVDDLGDTDSSNSFSFFHSPDSFSKVATASGRRPHASERNRIKIQLSRRSGSLPQNSNKASVALSDTVRNDAGSLYLESNKQLQSAGLRRESLSLQHRSADLCHADGGGWGSARPGGSPPGADTRSGDEVATAGASSGSLSRPREASFGTGCDVNKGSSVVHEAGGESSRAERAPSSSPALYAHGHSRGTTAARDERLSGPAGVDGSLSRPRRLDCACLAPAALASPVAQVCLQVGDGPGSRPEEPRGAESASSPSPSQSRALPDSAHQWQDYGRSRAMGHPMYDLEASPTNVEAALWEEFERLPSVQLLHSMRRELRTQLAGIISQLEQSLVSATDSGAAPRRDAANGPDALDVGDAACLVVDGRGQCNARRDEHREVVEIEGDRLHELVGTRLWRQDCGAASFVAGEASRSSGEPAGSAGGIRGAPAPGSAGMAREAWGYGGATARVKEVQRGAGTGQALGAGASKARDGEEEGDGRGMWAARDHTGDAMRASGLAPSARRSGEGLWPQQTWMTPQDMGNVARGDDEEAALPGENEPACEGRAGPGTKMVERVMDKENVVNDSNAAKYGTKVARRKGLGVPLRLAVREKDLWC